MAWDGEEHAMNARTADLKRRLVAILRGVKPQETADCVAVLVEAGFEAIEIPLNSPDPFRSIEIAVENAPSTCLIGAGTVLTTADVDRLHDAGGRLMVSPNVDRQVIERAVGYGMVTLPGVFTATEALLALKAGASGLKFFPASVLGPGGISAIRAILPEATDLYAVGGVDAPDFAAYGKAGCTGFGLGSSLYKPGDDAETLSARAARMISAYDKAFA